MVNEDDGKPVKKPVPLPRKSLQKQNKFAECKEGKDEVVDDENVLSRKKSEGKSFIREDWKSASGSFVFEKGRLMKNEVHKLEKSVKSMLARRASQSKSRDKIAKNEHCRSESLPDDSVFLNISFNSPLTEDEKCSSEQADSSIEDMSFYETELSPPSYPPPDLPDEAVYNQMRSFGLSDQHSFKSTSSDSASTYDEVSIYQAVGINLLEPNKNIHIKEEEISEKDSSQFNYGTNSNRYEIIDEHKSTQLVSNKYDCLESLASIPESKILDQDCCDGDLSKTQQKNLSSKIKYIIHLFDPLQENDTESTNFSLDLKNLDTENFSKILGSNVSGLPESINKNASLGGLSKVESFSSEIFCSEIPEVIPPNLNEGHYGKLKKGKPVEPEKVMPKSDVNPNEPPPIPPRRIDLQSEKWREEKVQKHVTKEENEKYENIPQEEKAKANDIIQWSSLKRVARIVAGNLENRASYLSLPGKKSVKQSNEEGSFQNPAERNTSQTTASDTSSLLKNFPTHNGVIFRPGSIQRWGVLSQRKLTLFAHKDSPDVKETVPMDGVLSVQVTQNRINMENVGVHCFEISTSSRSQPLLFGVPSVSERHIWMRKLLESVGPAFPAKLSMDYTKAGWCYAKESITCSWNKCCILLHHRTLHLSSELGSLITADLRKARKLTLQVEGFPCEKVTEKGPLMVIDLQDKTLYLQMDFERETKAWEQVIMAAALKNGPTLCEQQLTKDDVPAVVDKCLNFVHTHGTFSEGIYRRNGSNRTVSQLLASFRCNAWSVQLSRDECTEFDVSSVLKRYFRDLPEPLLVSEIHEELGSILEIADEKEKIEKYKVALKKLPAINYLTARRLMGHLYFINTQKEKNLMGADNLAAIWGPTLLQVQEQVSLDSNCFKMEAYIINDLIAFYPEIFDVSKVEVDREIKILQMLESYHNNSTSLTKKPSGELKIWVYLHSAKNVDSCFNISINPQKTADEVCKELSYKTNDPIQLLCLEEVVCNGHLSRPMNHSEKVLDTVLRWSYWEESDRKDNCLVLAKNDLFRQVVQNAKFPIIVCEELKFADQKSKSFKSYQFEFSQAKLLCYKDKSCSQKIGEWKVEDIIWYLGHEPKRNPNARWSITFIEKKFIGPRTKEKPYFGNTICGTSEEQKFKLISAMLMAQYAKDILPTLNLME